MIWRQFLHRYSSVTPALPSTLSRSVEKESSQGEGKERKRVKEMEREQEKAQEKDLTKRETE